MAWPKKSNKIPLYYPFSIKVSQKTQDFYMKRFIFNILIFYAFLSNFCLDKGILNFTECKAFPIYAQQMYENPREATGRIVCSNCHLAQKPVEISVPQAVFPDSVFEAVIKIPFDKQIKQVLGNGKKGDLNVGAALILPKGFKLAPPEKIPARMKEKIGDIPYQNYSPDKDNIIVAGPISNKYSEMIVPILAPNPKTSRDVSYLKYPIYAAGNRGRGQLNPDGSKSNNNVFTSSYDGKIIEINKKKKKTELSIESNGEIKTEVIPAGPDLIVKEGDVLKVEQPLTIQPNVGGFNQVESEIVLQDPNRVLALIAIFFTLVLGQLGFVLKKKQFERVQLASGLFD